MAESVGFPRHSPDLRKHSCALALGADALGDVGCDDDGRLVGRPEYSDIVTRMLSVRAGFIGCAQIFGNFARKRSRPVRLASIQSVSWSREAGESTLPSTTDFRSLTIAPGQVVSRGSPARDSFSDNSIRSRLVTRSPIAGENFVMLAGPPIRSGRRLAAVLSLQVRAAWQRAATVIVPRRVVRLAGSWTGAASEELAWHVGRSKHVQRMPGYYFAMATAMAPCAPPRSTSFMIREES